MVSSSYSRTCQALITIFISIILAIGAISASIHLSSKTQIPITTTKPISILTDYLATNATQALRNSGFNFMATVLQISSEHLPSSDSTIFAIRDQAMENISLPSWLMRELLHYHTAPNKLLNKNLLQKPAGSCVPTVLHGKNLVITKTDQSNRSIEINGVLVSHPDIFTEGPIAIHGVLAPFISFEASDFQRGKAFIPSVPCNLSLSLTTSETESRIGDVKQNKVPWPRILRLLSSTGFVSFSIGLHAVLDGILEDFRNLSSVTIFVPVSDFSYIGSPQPLLERIVRFHISPGRYFYRDLILMPDHNSLPTLVPDHDLIKTSCTICSELLLAINNIEIVKPDAFSSEGFVVHGISRAFEMVELSSRSHRRISKKKD